MEASLLEAIERSIESLGLAIDVFGVIVIVGGILLAIVQYLRRQRVHSFMDHYQSFKVRIGRVLLLGLEILVAADIVKTIAVTPTFENLGILAGLVIIRTFLGWALILEVEGHWPWQPEPAAEVEAS